MRTNSQASIGNKSSVHINIFQKSKPIQRGLWFVLLPQTWMAAYLCLSAAQTMVHKTTALHALQQTQFSIACIVLVPLSLMLMIMRRWFGDKTPRDITHLPLQEVVKWGCGISSILFLMTVGSYIFFYQDPSALHAFSSLTFHQFEGICMLLIFLLRIIISLDTQGQITNRRYAGVRPNYPDVEGVQRIVGVLLKLLGTTVFCIEAFGVFVDKRVLVAILFLGALGWLSDSLWESYTATAPRPM